MVKEVMRFQEYCVGDDSYVLNYKLHDCPWSDNPEKISNEIWGVIKSGHEDNRRARGRCEVYQTALATNEGSLVFEAWSNQKTKKHIKNQLAVIFEPLSEHVERGQI